MTIGVKHGIMATENAFKAWKWGNSMKKLTAFLLVCVMMLGLYGCGEEAPGIGDTATIEDVEVKVVSVETVTEPAMTPAEGNIYILCEFEIYNHTGKDLGVSSMLSFQAYCDDYKCDFSLGALMSKGDHAQLDGTLGPNKKLRGVVGYEVPADWKELEIVYTPDVAGDSKLTFVAKNN